MRFCTSCGKELEEGTRFCTACGAKVDDGFMQAEPQKTINDSVNDTETVLLNVDELPLQTIMEMNLAVLDEIEQINQETAAAKAQVDRSSSVLGWVTLLGWLLVGGAALEIPVWIVLILAKINLPSFLAFPIGCAGFAGILYYVVPRFKSYLKTLETRKNTDAANYFLVSDANQERIKQIMTVNWPLLEVIPAEYRTYEAVSYFRKLLANKQADTLGDCINGYELYCYRKQMENHMEQLHRENEENKKTLERIEWNTWVW